MFLTSNVPMTRLSDGSTYRLDEDLVYEDKRGNIHVVPKGFESDLTSCHREGKWTQSAILHDWLYKRGYTTKKRADKLFLEAMKSDGVWWWRRRYIYRGVWLGGRKAWNGHRIRDED